MNLPSTFELKKAIFIDDLAVQNMTVQHNSGWTLTPTFFLIICILGSTINGTMLLLFVYDKRLRTPFNVYLMNLFSANLVSLLIQYPMAINANLHSPGLWFMGNPACTLYLYCQIIIGAGVLTLHATIAVNRTWAIIHPISYRSIHSVRFAVVLCGLIWLYIHLVMGPFLLVDTFVYRVDVETKGCHVSHSDLSTWSNVTDIVVYILPLCVVFLSFPIVVISKALRSSKLQRGRSRLDSHDAQHPQKSAGALLGLEPEHPAVTSFMNAAFKDDARSGHVEGNPARRQSKALAITGKDSSRCFAGICASWSSKYIILALLTISVAVCSAPMMAYFLLVGLVPGYWDQAYLQLAALLFSCQTVLDPVLFLLALERLRKSLLCLLTCRKPTGTLH
ncbi:hypothetical protein BV898_16437 [Hypsibius exemplaris]|uniref:G-protein coupled receptors family 1 profile domain-containing protein n=1 Tax=Hypsibius exemplaris TaxID=2072580 RepID=A0A9X6RLH4_HYPEX|nr:hypothetical protein BV898_16437 [Hypsibius exemplaris]